MVDQPKKPDFIVDARGNVEEVSKHQFSTTSADFSQASLIAHAQHDTSSSKKTPSFQMSDDLAMVLSIVFIILLIMVGNLILFAVQTNQARLNTLFNDANQSYLEGDYDQAIELYTQMIQKRPSFGQAYNNRGLVYQQLGDYIHALADANQAVRFQPKSSTAYNYRGLAHLALSAYDEAIADFDRAIQLSNDFGKAYYNRGLAYHALGMYPESIEDFSRAIEYARLIPVTSKTPVSNNLLNFGKSLDVIDANSFAVDLASAYDSRGKSYYALGETDRAIADFTQAIQLQPDRSTTFFNRGLAYYDLKDLEKAAADFNKVLDLNNDDTAQQAASEMLAKFELK